LYSHVKLTMADREEEEQTIAEDVVVTKYKMVAEIVNSKYCFEFFICELMCT